MSRQDLADAVNAYTYKHMGRRVAVDARYVGKLERGEHRWPFEPNRTALRQVLGKATNAELGFFVIQGHGRDPELHSAPPAEAPPVFADAPGVAAAGYESGEQGGGVVAPDGVPTARVTLTVEATQVRIVHDDDQAGRVVIMAGPVELRIEPSVIAEVGTDTACRA
ncbi:hypothetical protein [Micromonospora craniellae]|uniref:Uncharacterized protein n=1 Tax=Micromonospora craniellae TaxID=2294034 RepID=A0A372FSA5_9ACTN|nr:hypothetical protein [Micromonospora craniellae]QOC91338.1 hypothetical protein ID554_25620 [Micromonospora craniellae]RFS43389.1 hypothetical protein D0Q02_28140 [Micromonospora craniellae]